MMGMIHWKVVEVMTNYLEELEMIYSSVLLEMISTTGVGVMGMIICMMELLSM